MGGWVNEWMDAFRMAIFAYCGKRHIVKILKIGPAQEFGMPSHRICVKPSFIMDMQLPSGARGLVWD